MDTEDREDLNAFLEIIDKEFEGSTGVLLGIALVKLYPRLAEAIREVTALDAKESRGIDDYWTMADNVTRDSVAYIATSSSLVKYID